MPNLLEEQQPLTQPKPPQQEPIVLAQAFTVPGRIHQLAGSGGVIPFKDSPFGLRAFIYNNWFVIQLITNGINNPVKHQYITRPKQTVIKQQKLKIVKVHEPEYTHSKEVDER